MRARALGGRALVQDGAVGARAYVDWAAMARTPNALPSPEAILAREVPQRKPAAYAAVAATLLTAIAVIVDQLISADGIPKSSQATDLVEAFNAQLSGTPFPASFWSAYAQFKIDHAAATILVAVLRGAALVLLVPITLLLLRGARERGGQLGKFLEPVAVAGLIGAGITTAVAGIAEVQAFKAAQPALLPHDVLESLNGSTLLTINSIRGLCTLIVAVPVALGAIQALRVGLLPRIIGFMGVAVGMLFVIPYDQTGLLRAFWFAVVAWIAMGRFSGGLPEAWATGKAVVAGPRLPPEPRTPKAPKGPKGKGGTLTK